MPRNDRVAVRGKDQPDSRQDISTDQTAETELVMPAWSPSHLTPEIFHRFMTYESAFASDDIPQSASYHLLSNALPATGSIPQLGTGLISAPDQLDGIEGRIIRGVPKQNPSVASAVAAVNRPQKTGIPPPNNGIGSSATQRRLSPRSDHPGSTSTSRGLGRDHIQSDSLGSRPLAQCFQQLKISAQEQHHGSQSLQKLSTSQQHDVSKVNRDRRSDSTSSLSFPALPGKLADDGYHHRQRAAQFILIYSQQASREELSLCKRLSWSLQHSVSGIVKPHRSRKLGLESKAADQHRAQGVRPSSLEDSESIHSGDHLHDASGDEKENSDLEGCWAHLGNNKKKRKSSRFNSPGPAFPGTSDEDAQIRSLDSKPSAKSASYVSVTAESRAEGRALTDKTNTAHLNASQASPPVDKHVVGAVARREQLPARKGPVWRPSPRQTIGDQRRATIRKRLRAQLAPIVQLRRQDRENEQARNQSEGQAPPEVSEKPVKADDDATQVNTIAEKKIPPKRTLKAGKRAQAIRGSNSSAKPLTIAEIRARAAATSGAVASGVVTPPKTRTTPPSNGRTAARNPSPSPAKGNGALISRSNSVVEGHEMERISSHASSHTSSKIEQRSLTSSLAPTCAFTFRMSSPVTFRLREMRSQLDAATRDLSDTKAFGDSRGIVRALGETMYLPRSQKASSKAIDMVRRDYLDDRRLGAPLSSWGEKQQQTLASEVEKRLPSPAGPQERASTRQSKRTSSPAVAQRTSAPVSSGKKTPSNGRSTTARKPSAPSHKHGAACKHGPPPQHGSGSALFTDDDWICVFCEYELYYGQPPLMMRACRNRKKLVEKKVRSQVKSKLSKGAKSRGVDCQHDRDSHVHDHKGCTHHDDSVRGEACLPHCDHHDHDRQSVHADDNRDRCECGNSIHSSDYEDDKSLNV